MKLKRVVHGVLVLASAVTSAAGAQGLERDAWVAPAGTIHLGAGMEYTHFDGRFGPSGREPWVADLLRPLTASNFAPLATVRTRLDEFLAATGGGGPAGEDELSLGTPDLAATADFRRVPMELGIGLLPRIEVGVMVPIFRSELRVTRFALSGGTVGRNPAPEENAAALGAFGESFEELGRSPLLPLATSPLGIELRERVEAAGGEIVLPAAPLASDSLLNAILASELGIAPLATFRGPWRVGDAEASVRVRLLSTFGDAAFPTDSAGLDYRLAAIAGVRLPTGSEPDTLRLLVPSPEVGLSGWSAGMAGDLFFGRRLWMGAAIRFAGAAPVEVLRRLAPPGAPFGSGDPPRAVRWSPPSALSLRLSPRLRLEESVAVGLDYELLALGGSRFTGADGGAAVLDTDGGSAQRIGGSIRYSTLTAAVPGSGVLPVDALLSYTRTLSGPSGHPAAAALRAEARVFHRFWGR